MHVAIPLLTLEAQIKRRLRAHLRALGFAKNANGELQLPNQEKSLIRSLHLYQRNERLAQEKDFITSRLPGMLHHFAHGEEVIAQEIQPRLELIKSDTPQAELFRMAALTWSVPVSRGYGRRMRFLVWDDRIGKLIGVIALGDPVFNLKARDSFIGWDSHQRKETLVNVMDAYVLGALPPYNFLLCGKLLACLIRTREVRDSFAGRYSHSRGLISGRKKNASLVMVTTTSALGRSSIYNRLSLAGFTYFRPIGFSSGWGHFHVPQSLFNLIREYLKRRDHKYHHNHEFGDGPNWRLRAVRQALVLLGMNDQILRHGVFREVFVCELASNSNLVLRGEAARPHYRGLLDVAAVTKLAKARWIVPRAERKKEFKAWRRDNIITLLKPPLAGSPVQNFSSPSSNLPSQIAHPWSCKRW